ncbi:MAG: phosphoglycerate kinase [Rhodospirillales bacterium]
MPAFKTLDDLNAAGLRVLVRADLNTPMKDGVVTDATRLKRLAPTLLTLADQGARVIVLSHFGRPKGAPNPEMTLAPAAEALARACGRPVKFAPACTGAKAEAAAAALQDGEILVLENLRFHKGEEANDAAFAAELAKLGEVYVNDAFSAAHRAHASTETLARLLPAFAGRLMAAELNALSGALENPAHPVAALVGGAKVSSKLGVIGHMLEKVDTLIIGGGMANTFLHAQGVNVGASLCETALADEARAILAKAGERGVEIVLPVDAVLAEKFETGAALRTAALDDISAGEMILDVGPASIKNVVAAIERAKTLLWNGPLGAFEIRPFDTGTNAAAKCAAERTKSGALLSVAGGGDTAAALANAGVTADFSYVSAAGGAFLEFIEGKTLPGVQALIDAAA